jgi:site-specific recombinase XerD
LRRVDLPGAAHLVLDSGVRFLDPAPAVFEAMLEGWQRQQTSRFLQQKGTIAPRVRLVRRFAEFTNQYPWQWTPAELEAFTAHLISQEHPAVQSTIRSYHGALRMFCEFLTDGRYGWLSECEQRFGQAPVQIAHEWNTVEHVAEYEGQPGRRALTYDEVQALFDAADGRVDQIRSRGRKGAFAALRDAAILKAIYAFGLRRREAARLDTVDFRHNPRATQYGTFGSVQVRYGKASKGSPPKRRTVLTVPEMDWIVEILTEWCEEIRPLFLPGAHPALWVTERRSRISLRSVNDTFRDARREAGLPTELDVHALRHSYVTHLLEFGYPALFVQQQAGHAWGSTTALYTSVSDEFRNRLLEDSLRSHAELWTETP